MTKYEKISLMISLASLAIQLIDLLKQTMKQPNVTNKCSQHLYTLGLSFFDV